MAIPPEAKTVRGVKTADETVASNYIPPGAGIQGRILIEVIAADGTARDVTQTILSLGVTQGEPNGIGVSAKTALGGLCSRQPRPPQ